MARQRWHRQPGKRHRGKEDREARAATRWPNHDGRIAPFAWSGSGNRGARRARAGTFRNATIPRMRVVVIGGGIAGLSAAWAIRAEAARRAESLELIVLEAGPRPGGRIRTTREDGYLVEWAANAVQGTHHAAWRLAESVG